MDHNNEENDNSIDRSRIAVERDRSDRCQERRSVKVVVKVVDDEGDVAPERENISD